MYIRNISYPRPSFPVSQKKVKSVFFLQIDQRLYSKRHVGYGTLCWSLTQSLTFSHSRLWSQAFHPNDDERFPNYSKMEQPLVKGIVQKIWGKGWELTLCLRIDILWSMGTPCLSWFEPLFIAGFSSSKRTKNWTMCLSRVDFFKDQSWVWLY
jgi:hypothetical protein